MNFNYLIIIALCLVSFSCFSQIDSTRVVVFENGFWKKGYIEYSEDSTELKIETKGGKTLTYPSGNVKSIMTPDEFIYYKKEKRGEFDSALEKRKKSKLHFLVEAYLANSINGEASAIRNQAGNILDQFSGSNMYNIEQRFTIGGLFWKKQAFMGIGMGLLQVGYTDAPKIKDLHFPLFLNSRFYFGKLKPKFSIGSILGIQDVGFPRITRFNSSANDIFIFENSFGVSYWFNDGHFHLDADLFVRKTTAYPSTNLISLYNKYIRRFYLVGIKIGVGF